MKLFSPTQHKRLNEATGLLLLSFGSFLWLSLLSYQAQDPSWNTSAGSAQPLNLIGYPGSYLADLLLQTFGLAAYLLPPLLFALAWRRFRTRRLHAPVLRIFGLGRRRRVA